MEYVVARVEDHPFEFEEVMQTRWIAHSMSLETCKEWLARGSCPRGSACPYRHSNSDKVCKHWLRDLCKKGDQCEFLHEYNLKKMPECHFFATFGQCNNGDECKYLHLDPNTKLKVCAWYARGFCKNGPACRGLHVRKVACPLYLIGFCPDGPMCPNEHPVYEAVILPNGQPPERGSVTANAPLPPPPQPTHPGGRINLETVTCYKCLEKGHFANHCPNRAVTRRPPVPPQ